MTALVVCWTALTIAVAWHLRPAPPRLRELVGADPEAGGGLRSRLDRVPVLVGRSLLRFSRWSGDRGAAQRLGASVLWAAPALLLFAPAAVVIGALRWLAPAWRGRKQQRARADAVWAELPEIVDLFALCVGSGLTVAFSLRAVASRSSGVIAEALVRCQRRIDSGDRLADVVAELPSHLGEPVRPLVLALVTSERYGVELGPALERVAGEVRQTRRRRAEERARQIPVKLLFPLVTCVLPAFALLTVVPVLAGSLLSLDLDL